MSMQWVWYGLGVFHGLIWGLMIGVRLRKKAEGGKLPATGRAGRVE